MSQCKQAQLELSFSAVPAGRETHLGCRRVKPSQGPQNPSAPGVKS